MIHLPVELLIVGTSLHLRKDTVTSKEVSEFKKHCPYPLEYNSENKLNFSTYDEKSDTYTIKEGLSLPPQLFSILVNMAKE